MFDFAAITDVGTEYSVNDDRILINGSILDNGLMEGKIADPFLIVAVADGVGGLQMGYAAAEMVLRDMAELHKPGLERADIRCVVENANRKILQKQVEINKTDGLRTTLAAVYISENTCYVINAGDSRVYRYRDDKLEQLSKDHSIVQNLIDTGELTIEEAYLHPQRNVITKCFGEEDKVNARIVDFTNDVRSSDIFLLCSDGISDCLKEAEIARTVADKNNSLQDVCKELVDKAIKHGSTDNISICLVRREN